MAISHDELYIGTTWGCLVVAEGSTMRPITVFRPHEEEIKIIIPFESAYDESVSVHEESISLDRASISSSSSSNTAIAGSTTKSPARFLVTVGKGFRSLASRYIYLSKERRTQLTQRGVYAILWRSGNWIA